MVNYTYYSAFFDDSELFDVEIAATDISIDSSDISVESLKMIEEANTQTDLNFGQCNPHGIEIDIFSDCPNLIGHTITVTKTPRSHPSAPFTIGTYKVYSDTLDVESDTRKIEAWDALSEANNADVSDFWNNLTFPLTFGELRDLFFAYVGIDQEDTTLINDDVVITERPTYGSLSGLQILSDILTANAVSGEIGRDGILHYIDYTDAEEVSISESQIVSAEFATFDVNYIDKVQIRTESDDIGAIVGTGSNAYVIEDNMLFYGMTDTELSAIASTIYNHISGITYRPASIEMFGNPCIECGDMLHISYGGEIHNVFVMNREMNGIQDAIDSISCVGDLNRSEQVYSVNRELHRMRGRAFYIQKTVEGLKLQVEHIDENYVNTSTFEQTAEGLELQIESLQSQIDGEIEYYEGDATPTLLNYPAWDFCTNIPCNNTVQTTNDLHFIYTTQDYQSHLQDLYFDNLNVLSYRFGKQGGQYLWREIADSETSVILQRLTNVEATADGLTSSVSQISADLVDNHYTKSQTDSKISQSASSITSTVAATYATKTTTNQMQSQITQQAGQINSKVSKGNVSSEISQESNQITITGNRLVVNATNFALTAQGDLYTKDSFSMSNSITGERTGVIGFDRTDAPSKWVAAVDYDFRPAIQSWGHVPGHYETEYHAYLNSCLGNELIYEKCQYWDRFDGSQWVVNGENLPSTPGFHNDGTFIPYSITCESNLKVNGNLSVTGSKNRIVETTHFGTISQNAYETCEPYFGDIGESVIEEDGKVFIPIEEIFNETISVESGYQVFLQKYGNGDCYVAERNNDGFIVKGTPGIAFGWEIKARQKGYEDCRLKKVED